MILDLYVKKNDPSSVKTLHQFYLDEGSPSGLEYQRLKDSLVLYQTFDDYLLWARGNFKLLRLGKGGKTPVARIRWAITRKGKDYYEEPTLDQIRNHIVHRGNIAEISGRSGIIGIDVDKRHRKYEDNFWNKFYQKTLTAETPGGGFHEFFRNDMDLDRLEGKDLLLFEAISADHDVTRKGNEYLVIYPSEITREAIENRKKYDPKCHWKPGFYRWVYPKASIVPFSWAFRTAKKTVR